MSRIQIILPENFQFSTLLPVRITDINYGNHLGNDKVLSYVHEARLQFLNSIGYSELNTGNGGLIMSSAAIQFKEEVFYGDILRISVTAGSFSASGFNLYYLLENDKTGKTVALAQTGMVCYNYDMKKIVRMDEKFRQALENKK